MGISAIKPINQGTEEVEVNGTKRHVVRGYEEFVRDAFWDIFSSRKKARKSWAEEYQAAIKHYNDVVEYHKGLATEGLDKQRRFLIKEHNELAERLKVLASDIRDKLNKKRQPIPEFIAVLLPAEQEQNNQQEEIILKKVNEINVELSTIKAVTKDPLKEFVFLTKRCIAMQQEVEKLNERLKAEQEKLNSGRLDGVNTKQISRDDIHFDPYAYYNQIAKNSSHPQNIYHAYSDESLEFCIDNIFPDLEAFIEEQKVFLESQQINPVSRFFRKLFNIFTDSIDFSEQHQSFILRKELELRLAKQGLAQTAYDRINKGFINNSLDRTRFEKFANLIEDNGNFTVVNVPRADLEDLLNFVKHEENHIESQRRNWFSRFFLGDTSDYLEHKHYLKKLKNRLTTYKQDFRALTSDQYCKQFDLVFDDFKNSNRKPDLTIGAMLNNETDTSDFLTYIATRKAKKQNLMPQGIKWLWNRITNKAQVVELEQEIDYLNKLEQALNRKDIKDEYDANQDIRLVMNTETRTYSNDFTERYNEYRWNNQKGKIYPGILIQLVNQDAGFYTRLLKEFDASNKVNSEYLDNENFDESKRLETLEKLLTNAKTFENFVKVYMDENSKKDLSDIDREFLHYVKRVNFVIQNPYATLQDMLNIRLDDAYQNMVNLIIHHGLNDGILSTISNYINIVRYNIESGRTKVEQLEHVKKLTNNLSEGNIKKRFLTALSLLQSLINGESVYRNFETSPPTDIDLLGLDIRLETEDGRKNIQEIKDLCNLLISRENLYHVGGAELSEWLMRYVRNNLRKLFNRQGEANYQKNLSLKANTHTSSYHFSLIKAFGNGFDSTEQYHYISNDALKFFRVLFQDKMPGEEIKLKNLPETADEDRDNLEAYLDRAGISETAKKGYKLVPTENAIGSIEYVKCGQANLQYTIQEFIRQQNRVGSYPDKNKIKVEYIESYLKKYENVSDVNATYAKAITIAATKEQIQKYGQKLLSSIFKKNEVVLTHEEMEFIQDNKQILKDVIDKVINNYINSPNFVWNQKTENTLHEIASEKNKQRYTTKRIKELLIEAAEEEQQSQKPEIIDQAKTYILNIQNRRESSGFNYPDTSDNFIISELEDIFKSYATNNAWNVTLDELAALYLQNNPEILQQLRINKINLILNDDRNKPLIENNLIDTLLLDDTVWFVNYIKTHKLSKEVLSNVDKIRESGLIKLDEIFSNYCNKTNPKYWHKYAETLVCAFDESEKWLRKLRLRKVKDLIDKQDLQEAVNYIAYVTSSSKKDLLPKKDEKSAPEGSNRLDEIFKISIFGQIDIPGVAKRNYSWNEVTEVLVRKWGTPERLDTCLIARTAHLLIEGNIQLSEQHIIQLLNNAELNFTKGNLVKTEQGKRELLELLTFYAEKGFWNSNIELLIEYLEPESNNKKLLQQYRFKRLSELMNGVGATLGRFDIEPQNELLESGYEKRFKRKEFEVYQSLIGENSKVVHIEKMKEFFGVENFPAIRNLFHQYIGRIAQGIKQDTDAYYLCFTFFTSGFNSEVNISKPEEKKLSDDFFSKWISLLAELAYDKSIRTKAAEVDNRLRAGTFYDAKLAYKEEVQNLRISEQTNNLAESEKAKKTVVAIESTALEYMKDLIAYSAEVSKTVDAIVALANQISQTEKQNNEKLLQDFANIPLSLVASMQLKANIAKLLSGGEQKLEIFALKLLGTTSLEHFSELKEMLIAADSISNIEQYLPLLKNYIAFIEANPIDIDSCRNSSKNILELFIKLFCDKQCRYFENRVHQYEITLEGIDELNETTLIDSISTIAKNNESVKSKVIAIILEIRNKIGLDVKHLIDCVERSTDQVLDTIGQMLNQIVVSQREIRKGKICDLYKHLIKLAQESQIDFIKKAVDNLKKESASEGERKILLKQLFQKLNEALKDNYVLDIESIIDSLTAEEQNKLVSNFEAINSSCSSEKIFKIVLAGFKELISIFMQKEKKNHNEGIDTCANGEEIKRFLVKVTQSYREKRINYAVSMLANHNEPVILEAIISDLHGEFFASCVEETKRKANYLSTHKQKINDSVEKLDNELKNLLDGKKYIGYFDVEQIDFVVKGVDRNRKNQLLLKLEQLLFVFKEYPQTDIANSCLLQMIEVIYKSIKEGIISGESKQHLKDYKLFAENYSQVYEQIKISLEKIRNSQSVSTDLKDLMDSFSLNAHTNDRTKIFQLIEEIRTNNPSAINLADLFNNIFSKKQITDELGAAIKHYNSYLELTNKLNAILKSNKLDKEFLTYVDAVFFDVKDHGVNSSISSTLAKMKEQLLSRLFTDSKSTELLPNVPRTIWIYAYPLLNKIASVEQIAEIKVAGGNFILEAFSTNLAKLATQTVPYLEAQEIELLKNAAMISDKLRNKCHSIINKVIEEKNATKLLYIIDLIFEYVDEKVKNEVTETIVKAFNFIPKEKSQYLQSRFEEKILAGYISSQYQTAVNAIDNFDFEKASEIINFFGGLHGSVEISTKFVSLSQMKLEKQKQINNCIKATKAIKGEIDVYPDLIQDIKQVYKNLPKDSKERAELQNALNILEPKEFKIAGKYIKGVFGYLKTTVDIANAYRKIQTEEQKLEMIQDIVNKVSVACIAALFGADENYSKEVKDQLSKFINDYISYINDFIHSDVNSRKTLDCGFSYATKLLLTVVDNEQDRKKLESAIGEYNKSMSTGNNLNNQQSPNQGSRHYQFFPELQERSDAVKKHSSSSPKPFSPNK